MDTEQATRFFRAWEANTAAPPQNSVGDSHDGGSVLDTEEATRFFRAWEANTAAPPQNSVGDSHDSGSVLDTEQATRFFRAWEANTAAPPQNCVGDWSVFVDSWDRLNETLIDLPKTPEFIYEEFSEFAGSFDELFRASLHRGELTNAR
jgi:hypothetical protein